MSASGSVSELVIIPLGSARSPSIDRQPGRLYLQAGISRHLLAGGLFSISDTQGQTDQSPCYNCNTIQINNYTTVQMNNCTAVQMNNCTTKKKLQLHN